MTSNIPEVQELAGELAKKVSQSTAVLTPSEIGRALFGLQGLSSSASLIQESALGLDSDEVGRWNAYVYINTNFCVHVNTHLCSCIDVCK
jgi:hypothetical protein